MSHSTSHSYTVTLARPVPQGLLCICSLHVASVVQMLHMIMHHGGLLRKKVVDDLMMMAGYLAAAIHDFEHGGVNNDFLIQTRDKLAVTYNDISPLENHHLAAAARLMGDPRYRFNEVCMPHKPQQICHLSFQFCVSRVCHNVCM